MKLLAVFVFLLAVIAFWSFRPEPSDRESARNDSVALNYALFRNAVFDYALKTKTSGSVLPGDPGLTTLPSGWINIRPWQGLILEADGQLFCYVFGPARPEEVVAVQHLFNYSKAVGWNNAGVLVRNGDPLSLPSVIPSGALVSVIRLD